MKEALHAMYAMKHISRKETNVPHAQKTACSAQVKLNAPNVMTIIIFKEENVSKIRARL